jgi:hypothetical protein
MATQKKPTTAKKKPAAKAPAKQSKKRLSHKEEKFVEGYIANGGNATQAAKDAGYSENSARVTASRMLTKANISERIQDRLKEQKVTTDEIVNTLAAQMRGAITDVLPDDGGLISQIKKQKLGHLIRKIKLRREVEPGTQKQYEVVELEIHNSQTAAAILAKIKGLEQAPAENEKDKVERVIDNYIALHRKGLKSQLNANEITKKQYDEKLAALDKMTRLDVARVMVHYEPKIRDYYDLGIDNGGRHAEDKGE